jgi:hypothetical protein
MAEWGYLFGIGLWGVDSRVNFTLTPIFPDPNYSNAQGPVK